MAKIEYEDKIALIENEDIPQVNKFTVDDANEIKSVVNENDDKFLTNGLNVSNEVDEDYRVNVLKSTNLFDGKIELGNINADTGLEEATTVRTRSVSFIPVKPNTTYYFYRNTVGYSYRWIIGYDINQKGITDGNYQDHPASLMSFVPNTPGGTFTTSSTTYFVRWYDTISTELNDEVSINEGNTRLPYEKFIQRSINVDNEKYSDTLNVGTSVDSRNRVNILKSKNLFDSSKVISNYNMTSSGTMEAGTGYNLYIVPIKPNTNYIMSIGSARQWVYGFYTSYPTTSSITINGQRIVNTTTNETFTTPSNANFMCIREIVGGGGGNEVITNLMLNEGSTALPYEPYITPSIYVDNEEIYNNQFCNVLLNSDATITNGSSAYGTQQVLFDKIENVGNFTLSSNSIVIGKNISKVLVSMNMNIYNATDNHFYNPALKLYRGGTRIKQVNCPRYMRNIQGSYTITPYIFEVQENDVIKCEIQIGTASETFKVSKDGTNLFIQKLK